MNYHIPPSVKADHLALALTILSILDPKIKQEEIPEMISAVSKVDKSRLPEFKQNLNKAIQEKVADESLINRIYNDIESFFEAE